MGKLETVQWGMIGAGAVTEVKSGPAFYKLPHSKLVAVMARTEKRVKDYAQRHRVPAYYTDVSALIGDPQVNAVYVATPPNTHMAYAIQAMRAGKPVYVEKPMAMTADECKQMNAVSAETGVPLFVAFYRRGLDYFNQVWELLQQIGTVLAVDVKVVQAPLASDLQRDTHTWRVNRRIGGEGYFVDLAPHTFDILDYLLGPINVARGHAVNRAGHYEVADTVSATWTFDSGVPGSGVWTFSSIDAADTDTVCITGTEGALTFSTFKFSPIELVISSGAQTFRFERPQHIQQGLIETIVDELRGTGTCPSTGLSGLRTAKVLDMILAG